MQSLILSSIAIWASRKAEPVVLLSGSPLTLVLTEAVDTRKAKMGDRLLLAVYEDVKVTGEAGTTVLIPHGTLAAGRVTWVRRRDGTHSKAGIGITVDKLTLPGTASVDAVEVHPDAARPVPASNEDPDQRSPLRFKPKELAWHTERSCGAPNPTVDEFLAFYSRVASGDIKQALDKVVPETKDWNLLRRLEFRNTVVENCQIVFHKTFDDAGLRAFLGSDAYDRVKPLIETYRGQALPQLLKELRNGNAIAIAQFVQGIAVLVDGYRRWRDQGDILVAAGTLLPVKTGGDLKFTFGGPASMGIATRVRSLDKRRVPATANAKANIRANGH